MISSIKAAEDLLQARPDLVGIFAINDPSALGAVAALEKAGRIGATAVRQIKKYLDGDDVPKEVLIPTALFRKASAGFR